jgi:hypothetical protein
MTGSDDTVLDDVSALLRPAGQSFPRENRAAEPINQSNWSMK